MNLLDMDAAERSRDELQRIVDRLRGNPTAVGSEEVNAYRIAVRIDALCKAAQAGALPWGHVRCRVGTLGASLRDMAPFTASLTPFRSTLTVDQDKDDPSKVNPGGRQQIPRPPRQRSKGRGGAARGEGERGLRAA
jgi:hypothetical protein